jgi:hypothetical protein
MLSTIFSPISCRSGSRNAASAAATRVTGSGDSISRVVNGIDEKVTTLRARFTLASGTLFRKRFLGSGRHGDLAMAFCHRELLLLSRSQISW